MREVNLAKVKSFLSELAGRAAYTGEHIIITKRGRPFAAIISIKDPLLMGGLGCTCICGQAVWNKYR